MLLVFLPVGGFGALTAAEAPATEPGNGMRLGIRFFGVESFACDC